MKQERYDELLNTLRRWRDRFATDLREQIEDNAGLRRDAQRLYRNAGVGEKFGSWLEHFTRQLAIQFGLKTLFIRVLEDQELLPHRIRTRDSQQLFQELSRYLGPTDYLRFVFRDAAYLLPDLFEETEKDIVWPAGELTQEFLEEVWRRSDVDREGWLRYDFRNGTNEGFDTRFIGDLYQDIDAEARARYALLQTPHFISQFILENTLLKRFEEQDFREVTLIDPTCGSGHFLVDAFYMFADKYLAERKYPDTPGGRAQLARDVVERHLFGVDINPYACALARFRLMLAMVDFSNVRSLTPFRNQHFDIVNCDSLIPYEDMATVGYQPGLEQEQTDIDTEIQRRFGSRETIDTAHRLFSREFDVVVGNPPYISVKDRQKRDFYRDQYDAAYGKYGLAAPFSERFLELATTERRGGRVGLFVTNAFTTRQYGRELIETVLPLYDLQSVIDLDGVYIPGHGTPTLIMFLQKRKPKGDTVRVLSNLKGESGKPTSRGEGRVWQSILQGYATGHGYQDDYVDVYDMARVSLAEHPWQFGGPTTRLREKLAASHPLVQDVADTPIGFLLIIGRDEIFLHEPHVMRRFGFDPCHLRPMIIGEAVRNWSATSDTLAIYPYDEQHEVISFSEGSPLKRYFDHFHSLLISRPTFSGTFASDNLIPYQYHQFTSDKINKGLAVGFAFVATHNHPFLHGFSALSKQSVYLIQISDGSVKDHLILAGLMSTSCAALSLKEVCYNKGSGKDPVRDRYEYSGTNLGLTPLPDVLRSKNISQERFYKFAHQMQKWVSMLPETSFKKVFEQGEEAYQEWYSQLPSHTAPSTSLGDAFTTSQDLAFARDYAAEIRRDIRHYMIFLQEEIDWLGYEIYGLIPRAPLAEDYLTTEEFEQARLELGQRAFEQAGNGYKGDWPREWKKKGSLPGPAAELPQLSENMQRLIRDRVDIIRTNKDIALLEDPLYKRRWIPPDFDQEFTEALEWWLREMAEWELEQAGRPLHIGEWSKRLMQHERVRAALVVYTGSPAYDPATTIEKVIAPEAVPNRPEHYLSDSGLRKLARGEQEFKRADFSDADTWRVRGKLNIPRERYIAYTSFEPDWYGWAGWNEEQRAEALVYLLQQATHEGWKVHFRQCGLRASLRDVLPALAHLPRPEQQEFEGIAFMCGIRENCFCEAFHDAPAGERPPKFGGEPTVKQSGRDEEHGQLSLF